MKLVTKYRISAINSCWEKCDEKCAYMYMFNVYKNQLSWQTGSRNLMGPKTLPTIWGTYMQLVTKYQISVINTIRFLLPVCRFCWFLYTFNIHLYMHNFRRIFLSNYWWQKSDVWSQASYRYPILWGSVFWPISFLLPVNRHIFFWLFNNP
jgi:hypothetical protein